MANVNAWNSLISVFFLSFADHIFFFILLFIFSVLGTSEPRKTNVSTFFSAVVFTDRCGGSSESILHLSTFIFIPRLSRACSN